MVLAAVGLGARDRVARASGLTIDGGVVVDRELRGRADMSRRLGTSRGFRWQRRGDELVRIEHWQVAVEHARARALLDVE